MKLLILSKYGRKAASFRYRFEQFLPYFEAHGIHCAVSSLFDDAYLDERMSSGRALPRHVLRAMAKRIFSVVLAERYDLVIVHTEAIPYAPPWLEDYLAWRQIPYVYDFDDALFHQYDMHPSAAVRGLLSSKIAKVIARASHVFAGNSYLAEYADQFNSSVSIAPTVVDLSRYLPRPPAEPGAPFVIGWIGSPSTAKYLRMLEAPLRRFCADHADARVVAVGSGPLEMPGVRLEVREWSESREIQDIQGFDVGVMPLDDSPWSRGKCGFKIIQCMGCAIPVVASPVGVNAEIVEPGVSGFLATTDEEWLAAFERLYSDHTPLAAAARAAMGAAGRARAARDYSLESQAPKRAAELKQTLLDYQESRA